MESDNRPHNSFDEEQVDEAEELREEVEYWEVRVLFSVSINRDLILHLFSHVDHQAKSTRSC